MPQNNNREVQDFSKYDAMTSEDLAQILRLDSEVPEGNGLDIDTLLYITGVLAERNRNTGKTAQEAWNSFQQNYLDSEPLVSTEETQKTRNPWVRRAFAAAAAVVLIVGVPLTVKALNWEKIWNAVATWTKDTFSFVGDGQPEVDTPTPYSEIEYDSLQQALAMKGQEAALLPTWIPDGFTLDNLDVRENPVQKYYVAIYKNGDKDLTVSVRSYSEADPERIEISGDMLEIYTVLGVDYYIFSNYDRVRAMWLFNSHECSISGEITVEELKQMIDSIPKG